MFNNLSDRLQDLFSGLRAKGKLSQNDIDAAAREIKLALLEADVNYKVVKDFIGDLKIKAAQADVLNSLTPGQNVVKLVLDELTRLLGSESVELPKSERIPNVIMLVGLQGAGKTTAAAKLALFLKQRGHSPLLAALDIYRPAAIKQLETLGAQIEVPVYKEEAESKAFQDPPLIAAHAVKAALDGLHDYLILDTAGRLHVDETMMVEAKAIYAQTKPEATLMVVDAMTGQDAVTVVEAFNQAVDFDGVVLTKMDGDARGGAALSLREVTGKPILFASEGEKVEALEPFHPDRMAKRILGMGDVVSLIEKAATLEQEEAEQAQLERIARAELNFNDFVNINKQVRKIGGIGSFVKAIPGGEKAASQGQVDEHALDRMEVIINSMTAAERERPGLLNGSRRTRIADGAGVSVQAVNQLIKQFEETKKMMRRLGVAAEVFKPKSKKRPTKKGKGKNKSKKKHTGGLSQLKALRQMGNFDPESLAKLQDMLK
ncbi:MAG: signal recognition particle protein [Coriobacteriales bacterium]|jgi:signal recognition particle subunit SRP54|nr:signal recognition particle protein [Coriobacteriales bacterium]